MNLKLAKRLRKLVYGKNYKELRNDVSYGYLNETSKIIVALGERNSYQIAKQRIKNLKKQRNFSWQEAFAKVGEMK